MSTKTCTKCGVEKDVSEFSKNKKNKDGLKYWCKLCVKEDYEANREERLAKQKEYYEANHEERLTKQKEHYKANREEIRVKQKEHYEANRDKIRAKQKEMYEFTREKRLDKAKEYRETNRDKIRAKKKEYREANHKEILAKRKERYEANRDEILAKMRTSEYRAKANKRNKKRYNEDSLFRIVNKLRTRVRQALKAQGAKKFTSTMELIGCSPEFLTKRLEKQIKPGTKREDYHVDHIIPCAFFDLTKEEDQRLCFHWTNHQLLTGPVNESKSDDVIWSGHVYKPDEVPSEIREKIYAHCRSNMTLRSS